MAARRKANVLGSRNINSAKSLPTILSRKRKNEEDEMQTVSFNIFIPREISLNYFFCVGHQQLLEQRQQSRPQREPPGSFFRQHPTVEA